MNARLACRLAGAMTVVAVVCGGAMASAQTAEQARVDEAATVFTEIMQAPDGGIPGGVLDKAEAIAIFPGMIRGGFALGGQWGRGVICVRNHEAHTWSAPAFLRIAGGSFGLQLGGQSIDLVLVVMDVSGVQHLLSNKVKIGGEASAAAGPVGRAAEASTDIQMRAKILSYSRSRGLFAGVAVNGSNVACDKDANEHFYGRRYDSREVVSRASVRKDLPPQVAKLQKILTQETGR